MESEALTLSAYLENGSSVVTWVMKQATTIANFMTSNPVALTFLILGVIAIVVSITKRFFRV